MSLRQPLQLLSLAPSGKLLATACGSRIQVVDLENNRILAASDDSTSHAAKCMVRHIVWHTDSKFVSNAEDKHVKEWRIEAATGESAAKLVVEQERELSKRANAISITEDGQTLVIADKFGDVYAFPMFGCSPDLPTPPTPAPLPEASSSKAEVQENTPEEGASDRPGEAKTASGKRRKVGNTGGVAPEWRHVPAKIHAITPVIGHVSMLTTVLVLQTQGKIITADRDEHIRVSKWPQGWEIEHFLLGQRKFVSALALHPLDPNILITAGGDDTLRLWDLTTYKCIRKDISAKPLVGTAEIQVELPVTAPGRRARKVLRRRPRNAKSQSTIEDAQQDPGVEPDENGGQDEQDDLEAPEENDKEQTVVADPARPANFVPKIKKLDLGITQMVCLGSKREEDDPYVVVSSVGSSALLAWSARALLETSSEPPNLFLDLRSPILSIAANAQSNTLWVSLDVSKASEKAAVEVLHISDNQLRTFGHSALNVLRDQCPSDVSSQHPYPNTQALFPDTALLSKEPTGRLGISLNIGGNEEGDVEAEEDGVAE